MSVVFIVLIVMAVLGLLAVWLMLPRGAIRRADRHPDAYAWRGLRLAHRGLHNAQVPENSLPAFARAVERGYGVELDVHLTKDGELVILHDADVQRMCGVPGAVSDMTLAHVSTLRLCSTDARIPLLSEALDEIAGRVPVLVELKPSHRGEELVETLVSVLDGYKAAHPDALLCVESFDPRVMRQLRERSPGYMRAVLVSDARDMSPIVGRMLSCLAAELLQNSVVRPDMISYKTDMSTAGLRLMRLLRIPLATWTVTDPAQTEQLIARGETAIFEYKK